MIKTNVMRILDELKIEYTSYEYEKNQSLTGADIASLLKEPPEQVFKTLICKGKSKSYYAFMIPVLKELDLKKAAKAVNEKSVEMILFKDLLSVTGYVHGGCSPIGLKKDYKVSIDLSVLNFDEFYFSGGKVGVQVRLKVNDFIKIKNPIINDLVL